MRWELEGLAEKEGQVQEEAENTECWHYWKRLLSREEKAKEDLESESTFWWGGASRHWRTVGC
jgi:hypothetical protein